MAYSRIDVERDLESILSSDGAINSALNGFFEKHSKGPEYWARDKLELAEWQMGGVEEVELTYEEDHAEAASAAAKAGKVSAIFDYAGPGKEARLHEVRLALPEGMGYEEALEAMRAQGREFRLSIENISEKRGLRKSVGEKLADFAVWLGEERAYHDYWASGKEAGYLTLTFPKGNGPRSMDQKKLGAIVSAPYAGLE